MFLNKASVKQNNEDALVLETGTGQCLIMSCRSQFCTENICLYACKIYHHSANPNIYCKSSVKPHPW